MKTFEIIYADPPWQYADKLKCGGGAENHYETMPTKSIKKLPIGSIATQEAVLFMWATWTHLPDALSIIEAWGFEYKTCAFVWVKTYRSAEINQARMFPDENFVSFWGMGNWTRSNTEFCLLATRGKIKPPKLDRGVHQIIYSPIDQHSKKPNEARERIVKLMGDKPRVELFCRFPADGWSVWGNEVKSDISL